jgi:hypothetical protein
MNNVRFYEELENKGKVTERGTGNALALFPQTMECLTSVYDYPNSPVASTSTVRAYLRGNCKRISENRAREIHPALFERLD